MALKEFYSYKRYINININDFLVHYEFLYQKLQNLVWHTSTGCRLFVLKAVNLSEENEKSLRTTCVSLNYASMKDIKKVFSEILPLEHKNVPAVEEKLETINFNSYMNTKQKILSRRK